MQQAVKGVKQQFVIEGKAAVAGLKARDGKTNGDLAGGHAPARIVRQFKAQHVRDAGEAQKTPMQVAHGGGIQHGNRQIAQGRANHGVGGAKMAAKKDDAPGANARGYGEAQRSGGFAHVPATGADRWAMGDGVGHGVSGNLHAVLADGESAAVSVAAPVIGAVLG